MEQRQGDPMEPTHYVLVPFHDPGSWSGWESGGKQSGICVLQAVGLSAYQEQLPLLPLHPKGSRSQCFPSTHT